MSRRVRNLVKSKIRLSGRSRLLVKRSRSNMHIQLIDTLGKTHWMLSTCESSFKKKHGYGGNCSAAKELGLLAGKKLLEMSSDIADNVAFDRGGCLYHGRVKALADALREAGVKI